jgi:PST family polysaccharide transporter
MVLRLSQFLVGVLVARLVSPHEYGVFVVALTVYIIVNSFSDVGVTAAVVRERDRVDQIAPTVSAIAMGTSGLLALAMIGLAPYLASGLGAPSATTAVRVIAISVALTGVSATSAALLTRDFRQKERFIGDATMFLVSSTVLIIMAVAGSGVMALAWSRVVGQLASSIVVIVLAPKWYWPKFHRREARQLLKFGLPLSGSGFVWFSIDNIDFMVVGRVLGAVSLGYYNLAYNISSWPVSVFRNIVNNVSIPTLSRVRDSPERLSANLAVSLSALAAVSFPVSALCLGVADPLVDAVYGSRWGPAAGALAILVTFGSVRGIVALFCDVFVAVGLTRMLLIQQLIWLAVLLPAMIGGVMLDGIRGAAWAHLFVATIVLVPMYLYSMQRYIGPSAVRNLRAMTPPLLAAIPAAVVAHLVSGRIGNPWAALTLGALAGLIVYLALLGLWLVRLAADLRALYGRSGGSERVLRRVAGPRHAAPRGRTRGVRQARPSHEPPPVVQPVPRPPARRHVVQR